MWADAAGKFTGNRGRPVDCAGLRPLL